MEPTERNTSASAENTTSLRRDLDRVLHVFMSVSAIGYSENE